MKENKLIAIGTDSSGLYIFLVNRAICIGVYPKPYIVHFNKEQLQEALNNRNIHLKWVLGLVF